MGEEEIFITDQDLLGFSHYRYGLPFFGSFRGMRYRVERDPLKDPEDEEEKKKTVPALLLTLWPEPFSFDASKEEERESFRFSFSEEGFSELVRCLNENYVNRKAFWEEHREIRV